MDVVRASDRDIRKDTKHLLGTQDPGGHNTGYNSGREAREENEW